MSDAIIIAVITTAGTLIAGVIVALINTRNKNKEDKKSKNLESISNAKRIFYENKQAQDMGFYFRGRGGQIWKRNNEGKDIPITSKGEGNLIIDNDVLIIERTNTDGRFEIYLIKYFNGSIERDFIQKDLTTENKMKIKISCKVKVIGGSHSLKFVFKGFEGNKNFLAASQEKLFSKNEWVNHTEYIDLLPSENFVLRIDDMNITSAPSTILIKEFVLCEK